MNKPRLFSPLLVLCLVLTCSSCAPSAQTSGEMSADTAAAVSATLTAIASASTGETSSQLPADTVPPIIEGTEVSCGNLTVTIPIGLAAGSACEEVPEVYDPDQMNQETYPAYFRITLQGYPLSEHLFDPQIRVYPVARYQEILPDMFSPRLSNLQSLIAGGQPGEGSLPLLPEVRAMQEFTAWYRVMPFINGSGIRYLTMYSQAFLPVNNYEMIYTYQGLTADGQYWVSVIMPISHPSLPADSSTPPGGDWNAFVDNFPTYISDTTSQLDQASSDSFMPIIGILDGMVAFIQVNP